jgi:hypothetical protein
MPNGKTQTLEDDCSAFTKSSAVNSSHFGDSCCATLKVAGSRQSNTAILTNFGNIVPPETSAWTSLLRTCVTFLIRPWVEVKGSLATRGRGRKLVNFLSLLRFVYLPSPYLPEVSTEENASSQELIN